MLVKSLVIHHSAGAGGDAASIKADHIARGFSTIGYHAVICNGNGGPNGQIQPGRSESIQGAGVFGNNANKLHVCLVGNFENTQPTGAQLQSLGKWLHSRGRTHAVPSNKVTGHCEITIPHHGTLCPGKWMRDRLDEIRTWYASEISSATIANDLDKALVGPAKTDAHLKLVNVPGHTSLGLIAYEQGGKAFVELRTLTTALTWTIATATGEVAVVNNGEETATLPLEIHKGNGYVWVRKLEPLGLKPKYKPSPPELTLTRVTL